MAAEAEPPRPEIYIRLEPTHGWANLRLRELWEFRELLFFLTWRDVKVRYKQTILGASWAIIQPFMTMVVFTIFFGRLANISSDGLPQPIFYYAGLVPWTFFSNAVVNAAGSLVSNTNLFTKVYFPRLAMPISDVLGGLVDFALAFVVLLGMMLVYHITPTANIIWLPIFLLLSCTISLGIGLWFAAINVKYRDVRYAVPFLIQIWMFATPVAYPSSLIHNPLLLAVYGLNPMAGVVEGFRWALLGVGQAPGASTLISIVIAIVILVTGLFYFRRMEKTFADIA
jgi:lipopolysaccharide transport system permease protein